MFHILRRQMKAGFRKPLVIFTPKSLLRHNLCISKIKDFTSCIMIFKLRATTKTLKLTILERFFKLEMVLLVFMD